MRYLQDYFATVDLISEALGKYDVLATDAQTAASRSLFRAKALEAQRDLELLKNKRRAFLNEEAAIRPPSETTLKEAEARATELAAILAKEANAEAIINLATKGLDAFNKISTA
ncbi:MAG TPA: hypothetical protein VFP68_19945 [Burkholderiaceae bacterium]|nr:hypothetical protein [Burkholderiaceae bacterium]